MGALLTGTVSWLAFSLDAAIW